MIAELSASQLRQWLERGDEFVLLDVREAVEREFSAISTASAPALDVFIPMGELPRRISELGPHGPSPIVVYCHHGVRSRMVAEWMHTQGFTRVFNLAGGIDAWSVEVDHRTPRY